MEKVPLFCLFFALSVSVACAGVDNVFFSNADPPCSKLESIVKKWINVYLKEDITQAAGLPRLRCHDCFVQGCDALVVLDGSASGPSKQEAAPNLSLRAKAFEIINGIKQLVDKPCHVTVSCVDVTALAARDSFAGEFVRAWYAACIKPSAILLVPANKKFVVDNLVFQGSCQPGFIFKVDGMIDPPQNSESRKNSNKWLQFAKLERLTLRGRGLIDGQGENLWAGQYKRVNQQRSVAAIERLRKGRILVEPSEPKGHTGHGPHHH